MIKTVLIYLSLLAVIISCSAPKASSTFNYAPDKDTIRYIPYRKGDTWFFIDRQQEGPYAGYAKAWEQEWDRVWPFNEYGLAVVRRNNRDGWINTKGEVVVALNFLPIKNIDHYKPYAHGYAVLEKPDSSIEILDPKGRVVVTGRDNCEFWNVYNGKFIVYNYSAKTYGIMNTDGEWEIPMGKYTSLQNYKLNNTTNIYRYSKKIYTRNYYGLMLSDGTLLTDPIYDYIGPVKNGLCIVTDGYQKGIYNIAKRKVIKKYDKFFVNDFFADDIVHINAYLVDGEIDFTGTKIKKKGAINTKGKIVIPIKYDYLSYGYSGFVAARKDGKWGVVSSKTGRKTCDFIYDQHEEIFDGHWNLFVFTKEGNSGVVDAWGNIIIPFEYKYEHSRYYSLKILTRNLFCGKKNDKWYLFNRKNEVLAITKNEISYGDLRTRHGLIYVENQGYLDFKGTKYWND